VKFLITAGATREYLDPIRFISNASSGKMGFSISNAVYKKGHDVTVIGLKNKLNLEKGIKFIPVVSAIDMLEAVKNEIKDTDVLIMAAAVSDYRPVTCAKEKIKKQNNDEIEFRFRKNPDILEEVSCEKADKFFVGFCAETNDLEKNAFLKMKQKKIDMIIANDITQEGAGFEVDTNIIKILYKNDKVENFELKTKKELGEIIVDRILADIVK
jgi:phosphopantothenoylcysteine decarboxylase / phosphopantothenate---cysteine ligase